MTQADLSKVFRSYMFEENFQVAYAESEDEKTQSANLGKVPRLGHQHPVGQCCLR